MSLAPRWLDVLSRANPFRYIVEAMRAAFLGQYVTGEVGAGILVAALLVVLSVSIGVRTFRRENV
jgi:ABC-2 type transport system permease protein